VADTLTDGERLLLIVLPVLNREIDKVIYQPDAPQVRFPGWGPDDERRKFRLKEDIPPTEEILRAVLTSLNEKYPDIDLYSVTLSRPSITAKLKELIEDHVNFCIEGT